MANSAGMDVEFTHPPTLRVALTALMANCWSPVIDGFIQYIPPGTNARLDWECQPAGCWSQVLETLEANSAEGNGNRLLMRFENTLFDAAFEFFPDGDITIDCGIFRPRLQKCCGFTDTNWLLLHIAAPLANTGALIDKVCFSEIRSPDDQPELSQPELSQPELKSQAE